MLNVPFNLFTMTKLQPLKDTQSSLAVLSRKINSLYWPSWTISFSTILDVSECIVSWPSCWGFLDIFHYWITKIKFNLYFFFTWFWWKLFTLLNLSMQLCLSDIWIWTICEFSMKYIRLNHNLPSIWSQSFCTNLPTLLEGYSKRSVVEMSLLFVKVSPRIGCNFIWRTSILVLLSLIKNLLSTLPSRIHRSSSSSMAYIHIHMQYAQPWVVHEQGFYLKFNKQKCIPYSFIETKDLLERNGIFFYEAGDYLTLFVGLQPINLGSNKFPVIAKTRTLLKSNTVSFVVLSFFWTCLIQYFSISLGTANCPSIWWYMDSILYPPTSALRDLQKQLQHSPIHMRSQQ